MISLNFFLVTHLLEGVMDRGTGKLSRQLGVRGAIAGKTGTTNDYRDAWFIGFTPQRVAGVWVGFDQVDVTGLSGHVSLDVWCDTSSVATLSLPDLSYDDREK